MKNAALRSEVPKNKTKGRKPKASSATTSNDERIALFARKFGVMNELFLPEAAFLVNDPDFDPMDPDRYKDPATVLQGVISELFEAVPEDLHSSMREHSHFRDVVSTTLFKKKIAFKFSL